MGGETEGEKEGKSDGEEGKAGITKNCKETGVERQGEVG